MAVPTINIYRLSFYTTLSEAVPSIIMTVILSNPTAASATHINSSTVADKMEPVMKFKFILFQVMLYFTGLLILY